MMKQRGHIVIHYGHEDSDVECTEHVTVLTRQDYQETYGTHDFRSKFFKFDLNDQAYRTFNENAIREVNARKQPGDFLLAFWGSGHETICKNAGTGMIVVEPGIGYPYGHFAEYKIFESYALYHSFTGLQRVGSCCDMNTWSKEKIIPNYFEPDDFDFSAQKDDYFLFVGRIGTAKGLEYAIRMTEKLGIQLKVAGQNVEGGFQEVGFWPPPKHVDIIGHIDTEQKKHYMSRAKAVICFSMFTEPFCGVHVEAMMSGTPVLTSDWGAFTEYVIDGVTGFRCRTLDELVEAGRKVHTIDPMKCREWAMSKFSTPVVAKLYEDFFESIRPKHRVAVWLEANWAFGRYARSIKKYMQDVDVYDWANGVTNKHLWVDGHWRDYETIISNTTLLRLRDLFGIDVPEEMSKRFLVVSFFPKFEGTGYFQETLKNFPKNARYGGASLEICKVMREMGVSNVKCLPFTADLEEFQPRHAVRKIKRLGIIGGPSRTNHPEYQENKGIPMFDEICRLGGFEPVYIHGRTGDIYYDVDLLICCSKYEGGPTGLFEAAALGIPILSRRVGCAQDVKGIAMFDTVNEALTQLAYWNENIIVLEEYTKTITHEIRTNWGMKTLIDRHLKPTVYGLEYVMKKYGSRNYLEGCDKATIHSYSATYESLFSGLRDEPVRLVEIGVCSGASLKVWEEYFTHPDAEFIGIDISSENIRYSLSERSKVLIQDATRDAPTGMFDIIIDDGSHVLADQISALQLFHSQLRPGGLYIIEDVQSIENANEILKTAPLRFELKDLRSLKEQYDDIMLVGKHCTIVDFIEIGTSDFDTEIQKQDGRTGLAVEPVQLYLAALPDSQGVQKVNAAISNYDGKVNVYSVTPDQIKKHNFPDWVRGCNSIGTYHPRVLELIQANHLDEREVVRVERIDVMTFGTLCRKYSIKGCRYLKIDTEGHDHVILHSYMDSIEHEGVKKALRIHFETNELTDVNVVDGVLERLRTFGYQVVERGYNTTVELIS